MKKLILVIFVLFLLLVGTVSHAEEVVLMWDPSIDAAYLDPEEAYKVYLTETEGEYVLFSENQTTNNLIGTVANHVLTFTATVPDEEYECWFVVTATDTRGLESDKSNEVTYLYVRPAPGAPPNLRRSVNDCMSDINQDGEVDKEDVKIALSVFSREFGRTDCEKK